MDVGKATLGEIVQSLEFTEEHKMRLASNLRENKLGIVEIFRRNRPDDKNTVEYLKRIKIPGFQPGKPLQLNKAADKIVSELARGNIANPNHWNFYRTTFVTFVQSELANLNKLLLTERVDKNQVTKDKVLEEICKRAFAYDVTANEVEMLYTFWAMPQLSDVAETLKLCAVGNQAEREQKKKIQELEAKLATTQNDDSKFDSLSSKFDALLEKVDKVFSAIEVIETGLEKITKRCSQLESQINSIGETAVKNSSEQIRALVHTVGRNEKAVTEIKTQISGLVKSDALKEVKKTISNESEARLKQAMADYENKAYSSLAEFRRDLEARLDEHIRKASAKGKPDKVQNVSFDNYISPISPFPNNEDVPFKVTEEINLIKSWEETLNTEFQLSVSPEFLTLYHRAFLYSNVIILDDHRLFSSWTRTLGWEKFLMNLAASPSWSDESDWGSGAYHLFPHERTSQPRFLIIRDYDKGLVSSYLTPSIVRWNQLNRSPLQKLILVPAESGLVTKDVARFGITIRSDDMHSGDLPQLKTASISNTSKIKIQRGVNPNLAEKWAAKVERQEFDLRPLEQSLEIKIPAEVNADFIGLAGSLALYLDSHESILSAARLRLLPWIQASYGESAEVSCASHLKEMLLR